MTSGKLITILFFLVIFIWLFKFALAQPSSDVIAIRVIENPEHHSALRWYQEKRFSGSPQSIIVDGYNAIRDGRTVYVNAANTTDTDTDTATNKFYTNIYLISYNQDAESATVDIFGRMVTYWKFNSNIADYKQKAKVVRDTIRLENLYDIKSLLDQYVVMNRHCPQLKAGSYLKNISVSTWPSWQNTFAKELGVSLPEDNINKLGTCVDSNYAYNPKTCWDEKKRHFAGSTDGSMIKLPSGSNVFVYWTDTTTATDTATIKSKCHLCTAIESGYTNLAGSSGPCGDLVNYELPKP